MNNLEIEACETIYATIKDHVIDDRGFNCWLSRRQIVIDSLRKLQPSVPDDQTNGFIAYNVPDKDRMKMKTGRFLTRKLKLNSGYLNDKTIQNISNVVNQVLFPDIKIRLLKGAEITQAYVDEVGSRSCMTTKHCSHHTKLYESNPDRFQMLTMHHVNDSARAIVHKFDNGRYMLDRVYASNEILKNSMKAYARNQNWYIGYGIDDSESDWTISGLDYVNGEIPYMDTMMYYRERNGLLDITADKDNSYDGVLENIDGTLEGDSYCCCDNCGEDIHIDDCYSDENSTFCEYCFSELFSYCEYCESTVSRDDVVQIKDAGIWVCGYCANNRYTPCGDCGEYVEDDYILVESTGEVFCGDCITNNHELCGDCREYYPDEDLTKGLCEDCTPDDPEDIPVVACKVADTPILWSKNDNS